MSPVNKEEIITLIGECRKATAQLSSNRNAPRAEVLASEEKLGNIKYQFIIAVEAAIGICQHLSAKKFNAVPESYATCYRVLEGNGLIDSNLASRMADLARFRKVLLHLYGQVDNNPVLDKLEMLPTIEQYLELMAEPSGLL
ncbi:MAG: hypothetical protein C4326_02915 [Ignavibacteria bacterium]